MLIFGQARALYTRNLFFVKFNEHQRIVPAVLLFLISLETAIEKVNLISFNYSLISSDQRSFGLVR